MRVAVIFDDSVRPETTGVYCRRALGELCDVEHFRPSELSRIRPGDFDLFLRIDDGLKYRLPEALRPCVWWAIDVAWDFSWYCAQARDFDLVFCAQRPQAELVEREIGRPVHWLPLACDPAWHRPHAVAKEHDIAFVGNIFPGQRADLLELIQRHFPRTFVGQKYFEAMAQTYSASRIVFNCALRDDVNMRVFEALACGSLLITNDLPESGQSELFQDGVHLVTYRNGDELLERLHRYLEDDALRERIAKAGAELAISQHTYRHRMATLLEQAAPLVRGPHPVPSERGHRLGKEDSYFQHARPEVLELVPRTARQILDLGCGNGLLGAACRSRQGARVTGVELDQAAAAAARAQLDRVVCGDLAAGEFPFEPGEFDCVICADILEHVRDPGALLARIRTWLSPAGSLVVSLPNVRHHSVVRSLLAGNWTYETAGLLDQDHVRFFTRRELEKMLYRAGFAVEHAQPVVLPADLKLRAPLASGEVRVGGLHLAGLAPQEAEEFFTYQFLVRARPAVRPPVGLTSIILVTRNQIAYTRQCLDSLRLRTDEPYELIVVDNGSTDGTPEYLESLPGVRLIRNAENRGFPAAVNQGLEVAQGAQLLLLNNDTILTTGWLTRLLEALHQSPEIGLVGPCSNNVSGEQQVPVSYTCLEDLDGFAWDWGKREQGQVVETDRLVGFCLLFRRELFDTIGLLDERFGIGCFEDDDYCRRAQAAGFRALIVRSAFVHHFGSRTFAGEGVDLAGLLADNQAQFEEKWAPATRPVEDVAPPPDAVPAPFRLQAGSAPGLRLEPAAPCRLSLCMIVRDNARSLRPCLDSVRPWVDELVVVDTGSMDGTPEIAQQCGARVFHFPWGDDFSAARNESVRHARGEWIFWMDSDDILPADCGEKLRALARGAHAPEVQGYILQVHCPGPERQGTQDVTIVDHVKLFRNRPELRFEGRIHEQILPAIRRAGGEVAWTDLHVVHAFSEHSPAAHARKLARDFRILQRQLAEQPDHPFVLFNLGMTHVDAGQPAEAIPYLERSITVAQGDESHLRKAHALLVQAQVESGRTQEARATCHAGLARFPDDPELLFRQALLDHQEGRLTQAAEAYEQLLRPRASRYFVSLDPSLCGYKARQNLALVLEELGHVERAAELWREITQERPTYQGGWQGLIELLCRQGDLPTALAECYRLERDVLPTSPELGPLARMLAGRLALARGDLLLADRAYADAVRLAPSDPELLRALCRFRFEQVGIAEAEAPLRRLVVLDPADPVPAHNLGLVCARTGRETEAERWFEEAARRRPEHAKRRGTPIPSPSDSTLSEPFVLPSDNEAMKDASSPELCPVA